MPADKVEYPNRTTKLSRIRRKIASPDRLVLRTLVNKSLKDNPDVQSVQGINVMGITPASPSLLKVIYEECYKRPYLDFDPVAATHFNRLITEHKLSINAARSLLEAKLGEVDVYGRRGKQTGPRHIAAKIHSVSPAQDNHLESERIDLMEQIIPDFHHSLLHRALTEYSSHLSLAITNNRTHAYRAVDILNSTEGIEGRIVQFRPAVLLPVTYQPPSFQAE